MPSKNNKIIQSIEKVLGPHSNPYTYNFINNNKTYLKNYTLPSQLNTIGNYVHLLGDGNYSCLNNITAELLYDTYIKYIQDFKLKYNNTNYVEHNKIILDERIDGVGFYWVDLQNEFCVESMIRMEDCGRVNFGNTTLELREQTKTNNVSHMILVYEVKSKNIKQIKGKQNRKPKSEHWIYLFNLLTESEYTFNQYVPTYKPENDLLISDLPVNSQLTIYSKHPNLVEYKKLI
jgi:hypothetical protein